MTIHPSMLAIVARAQDIAGVALTAEASGIEAPTQIGVAGLWHHEASVKPTRLAAMKQAADEAKLAATTTSTQDKAGASVFRLGWL